MTAPIGGDFAQEPGETKLATIPTSFRLPRRTRRFSILEPAGNSPIGCRGVGSFTDRISDIDHAESDLNGSHWEIGVAMTRRVAQVGSYQGRGLIKQDSLRFQLTQLCTYHTDQGAAVRFTIGVRNGDV